MALAAREGPYEVQVYPRDHPPPHAHVFSPDGEWKVALGDPATGVRLIAAPVGALAKKTREAVALVASHREACVQKWRQFHGN